MIKTKSYIKFSLSPFYFQKLIKADAPEWKGTISSNLDYVCHNHHIHKTKKIIINVRIPSNTLLLIKLTKNKTNTATTSALALWAIGE